jgi:Domain of unknown function (DUF5642)
MLNSKALLAVLCTGVVAACASGAKTDAVPGIANVKSVSSTFGPQFHVTEVGPAGIDPRLLTPQKLPDGVTFNPADCAKYGTGQTFPSGVQGNMAAVTAEGEGNRFIAIAVETSEPITFDAGVAGNCKHVTFDGANVQGVVDVVDSPQIEGAQTIGTHRQVQTVVDGVPKVGELYNYVAYLPNRLVVVTANSLVVPGQPLVPVNTQRARDLLTAAVGAVRG